VIGWVALVPLLLSAVFGLVAPAIARRLPPALGSWLLSGGAVLAAAASSASLGLLALLVFAQTPLATAQGRWSAAVLRHSGVPAPVGLLAAAAAVAVGGRAVRVGWRRGAAVRHAYRLAAALPASGELAVLDLAAHQALAVPGRPGRIVVSTGLLRSLDGRERRALLAHERAHLRGGHHWHQSAVALAAALNPGLARVPAALEQCCERWADERAAAESDRATVAGALVRTATGAAVRRAASPVVLAASAGDLAARIGALHAPAPQLSGWRLTVPGLLLAATALAVAVALHDVESVFEHAQAVYRARAR
jgi:Zn-dependent protease with chaperone function